VILLGGGSKRLPQPLAIAATAKGTEVRDYIANIVMWTGAITALLTLLDFFLSENWKVWLNNKSLVIWDWLDDARRQSLVYRLLSSGMIRLVLLMNSVIALVIAAYAPGHMPYLGWYTSEPEQWVVPGTVRVITVLCACLVFWYLPREGLVRWMALSRSLSQYCHRAFFLWFWLTTIQIILESFAEAFARLTLKLPQDVLPLPNFIVGVLLVFGATSLLFGTSFFLIACFTAVSLLIFTGTLALVEGVMRRIAEYPKGPLLAVSTLTVGIGALFKSLE
jgi:hypothetical protein